MGVTLFLHNSCPHLAKILHPSVVTISSFKMENAPVQCKMNMNILLSEGAIKYQVSKNKTEIRDKAAPVNKTIADEQITQKAYGMKKEKH